MDHGLELISHILEILDRTIHTQSYPGNIGSYDPYLLYVDVAGGRGGRGGTAAAAAASQQLSHLARALENHAQGPNIPFGVNPSLRPSKTRREIDK